MNYKYNAHYRQTHEKIQAVFLSLASKHQEVTVKQICEEANIHRSTFYQHYEGIGSLMNEIYENKFTHLSETFFKDLPKAAQVPLSYESFQIMCTHIYENKDFYRIFLNIQNTFPIRIGFQTLWNETFKPAYEAMGIKDENIMLHRFICIQSAFTNTVKYWVNQDCIISVEAMAKILSECLHL